MVICPWCGTHYETFQSKCTNCGGLLHAADAEDTRAPDGQIAMPPPAPREIADSYAWRLLRADGWAIASLIFVLLGAIFFLVGVPLTVAGVTAFVGLPFAGLGFAFLAAGGGVIVWRYQEAQKTLDVLRNGEAARGEIIRVEQNYSVSINNRHPWIIAYRFQTGGRTYEGRLSTLNTPGSDFEAGAETCVLYMASAPERNALYPHP